jgi:hypothetical protein
MSSGEC